MFGTYQCSNLRIEVSASADKIGQSLTDTKQIQAWLWPQRVKLSTQPSPDSDPKGLGARDQTTPISGHSVADQQLTLGQTFTSYTGPAKVTHQVEQLSPSGVRFLLSGSIDGFHEWQWGDGWVQSRLEGISLLPLSLGQTCSLLRLKQHLA